MAEFFREWRRCLIGLLTFVPFFTMLAIHAMLGLSDAWMAKPQPGQTFWPVYNMAMVFAFYSGIAGYFAYLLSSGSSKRGSKAQK